MKLPKEYFDQIRQLSLKAMAWMEAHPGVQAKVQFNYPDGVFLAAVPKDAIDHKYVTADSAGMDLLKAMGALDDDIKGPSISMIRFALEYMEEIKKEAATNGNTRRKNKPPKSNRRDHGGPEEV
jgi:hypothetical protein